jgi:hypothetical protein
MPGTFCPYRNVHNRPAVICARLGTCILNRYLSKEAINRVLAWNGAILNEYLSSGFLPAYLKLYE